MYGIFLLICIHISVSFNIVISTIYDSEESQIAKRSYWTRIYFKATLTFTVLRQTFDRAITR